jgi:hypothetical protein
MKHNLEGRSVNAAPKWRRVKEVERSIIPKDLEMINFIGCMHGMIRFLER